MWRICTGGRGGRPDSRRGSWVPAPKRDITPWELTTNGARQHPGDGGPGLAEASAGREMSRIGQTVMVLADRLSSRAPNKGVLWPLVSGIDRLSRRGPGARGSVGGDRFRQIDDDLVGDRRGDRHQARPVGKLDHAECEFVRAGRFPLDALQAGSGFVCHVATFIRRAAAPS